MKLAETILYQDFVRARRGAAVLMDEFRETDAADPRRSVLWRRVVKQTEASRLLLESWLLSSAPAPAIGEVWDIEIA